MDVEKRNAWLMGNQKLIYHIINKHFYARTWQFEDLVQVGNLGALKALSTYDESYGNSNYIIISILRELYRYCKQDNPVSVPKGSWSTMTDEIVENVSNVGSLNMESDSGLEIIDLIMADDSEYDVSITKLMLDEILAPREYEVTQYRIQGYSHKEIGSFLGIGEKSSRVNMSRAAKKIRKALEG